MVEPIRFCPKCHYPLNEHGDHCNFSSCISEKIQQLQARIELLDKPFRVTVEEMKESHQTTYWVCLDRPDRALDAKPWDDGRLTPAKFKDKDHAYIEADSWANFLGVEPPINN